MFFLISILMLGIGAMLHLRDDGRSDEELSREVSDRLQREFELIESESTQLKNHLTNEETWRTTSHAFYLIDRGVITRWNTNGFIPDLRLVRSANEMQYLQVARGSFLTRSWSIDSSRLLLCVLPLNQRYKITNQYLAPEWNASVFGQAQPILLDRSSPGGVPVRVNGRVLFNLQEGYNTREKFQRPEFLLGSVSVVAFLIGLFFLTRDFYKKGMAGRGLLVLLGGCLFLRWIMVAVSFPQNFSNFPVFDPLQFASSALNPSIGDLFLNTLLILAVSLYLFFAYTRIKYLGRSRAGSGVASKLMAVVYLLMAFFALVLGFLFIETIYNNSSLSLDITEISGLDQVRLTAFMVVVAGSLSAFLLCHVFFHLAARLTKDNGLYFLLSGVAAGLLLTGYYLVADRNYFISLATGSVYFLALYFTGVYKGISRFSFSAFVYFVLGVAALSVQGAWSIKRFGEKEQREAKFRFANAVLIGRDILGEYLLRESAQQISRDPFIRMGFSSPFISNGAMKQKIRETFINSYFDRYDVRISLFSPSGKSLEGEGDLASLLKGIQKEEDTQYSGIYFTKGRQSGSGKNYLVIIPVERAGHSASFVVLELSLKRVIPKSVYPELLVDTRFTNYFATRDFSYSFFTGGVLTGSFGVFNYEKNFPKAILGNENLYTAGTVLNGFSHIGVEDDEGNVTVVSSPVYSSFNILANFAFLFTAGLGLIFLTLVLLGAMAWRRGERLTYAARIQVYIYLGFLLPLIAVSVTTIGVIGRSAREQLYREFQERAGALGEQLSNALTLRPDSLTGEFESRLIAQAKLANLDATVFLPSGKLLASSQPQIFRDQLVSDLVSREAWRRITLTHEDFFITDEAIGRLRFNNSYIALKSPATGQLTGILSVPFFDSEHSLQRQQVSVLANIMIIFVIIFLLFLALSYFAVRWLTFPLHWITRSLAKTSFTGQNAPLTWNADDEIGLMVREYNKMVENLEKSKIELARSQKESAWREIAKQIAHEIKNPLTPMRLTLQRVEQFIKTGKLEKDVAEQSVQTLLTQVEILNEIAASFSAFARMPAPILQKLEITGLLRKVAALHDSYPSGSISIKAETPVFIMGDEQLLNRVFSNIVLNAIQSAEEGQIRIEIDAVVQADFCIVSVRDNGKGIDDSLRDKVFLPHFSTKKSGSGLGLAIARQGIEQSGGAIWFESEMGRGTTFFVKVPLAR